MVGAVEEDQGESCQAESCRCCTKNIPECVTLSRAARGRAPRSHLRVHGFVLLQAHRVPKGLAAYFASKGSRAAVGPAHVHLEPVWRGEHLRRMGPGRRTLRGANGRGLWLRAVRGAGAGPAKLGARKPHLAALDALVGAAAQQQAGAQQLGLHLDAGALVRVQPVAALRVQPARRSRRPLVQPCRRGPKVAVET